MFNTNENDNTPVNQIANGSSQASSQTDNFNVSANNNTNNLGDSKASTSSNINVPKSDLSQAQPEQLNKKDQEGQAALSVNEQFFDSEASIDENITIHTMPGKFRFAHSEVKHKKTGIFIIIAGLIFLLAIGGAGAYYYFFILQKSQPNQPNGTEQPISTPEPNPAPTPAPAPAPTPAPAPAKSARQVAEELIKKLNVAGSYLDYEEIIREYGSINRITKLNQEKNQYSGMLETEKIEFFNSIIDPIPSFNNIVNIADNITGNKVTLSITIRNINEKAIITMVNEENQWRLETESWPEIIELNPGQKSADNDKDGLTDKEELLLGCNVANTDSDGDGYNDLAELLNLYNPAGSGRLINNPNINKYLGDNYSLLYLASWNLTESNDDSLMIKSIDNQFFNVIIEANEAKESIDSWYKKEFDVLTIDSSKTVTNSNWRGIKSDDDLTIYLTDNKYDNIITISYIPNQNNILDYINIFEMTIKSLVIED